MAKRSIIKTKEHDSTHDKNSRHSSQKDALSLEIKENMSGEIQTLMPFSNYDIRMYAENKIGISDSTNPIIRIQTKEEAPEGPPTSVVAVSNSSQSLVITWKVRLKDVLR